jgi:hypothetical protein
VCALISHIVLLFIRFTQGRNLLCIHSKKHIKNPPEDIPRKQAQNLESMTVSERFVYKLL